LEREALQNRARIVLAPIDSFLHALQTEIPALGRSAKLRLSGWHQKQDDLKQEIALSIENQETATVEIGLIGDRFRVAHHEFVMPDEVEKARDAIATVVRAYFSPHPWS
jgi:hypothetical protein